MLQYFGHLMQRVGSLEKTLNAEEDWRQEEKGTTEDEIVGCHHRLNMSLRKLWEMEKDREAVNGAAQSRVWLNDWTTIIIFKHTAQ